MIYDERPDWPQYFMGLAESVKIRSSCPAVKVGAVIVNSFTKQVLATGFNNSPRGMPHCDQCHGREVGVSSENCKAIHAEMNAILFVPFSGFLNGKEIYTTTSPCYKCSQIIIQVGISKVFYRDLYPNSGESFQLLEKAGVEVAQISD